MRGSVNGSVVAAVLLVSLALGIVGMVKFDRARYDEKHSCWVLAARVEEGCLKVVRVDDGSSVTPSVEIRCRTWQEGIALGMQIALERVEPMVSEGSDQRFALLGMREMPPMQIQIRTRAAGSDAVRVEYHTIRRVEVENAAGR